eukprot:CAMPEP_0185477716 /NCGR_PEP_ID=MMETSP1366-20130426/4249_1 /TAXON_ID=38817 /ORGANISM="Gephyrocapsa oceanica, Strain RCC1303" /LENGTH=127 /DNA_ID=CAMNT_0028084909 /DNA_START=8 /DNA_END=388 /DNA_ORIENTATION=-
MAAGVLAQARGRLLRVEAQRRTSVGRKDSSRRISANLGKSRRISANLGKSRRISANLGKSRQISANIGESRQISANLGESRQISANLAHGHDKRREGRSDGAAAKAAALVGRQRQAERVVLCGGGRA